MREFKRLGFKQGENMKKTSIGIMFLATTLTVSSAFAKVCTIHFSPSDKYPSSWHDESRWTIKSISKAFNRNGIEVVKDMRLANIGIYLWTIPLKVGETTHDNGPYGTSKEPVFSMGIQVIAFEDGNAILKKVYNTSDRKKVATNLITDLKCD
jgi:hypothetical protein